MKGMQTVYISLGSNKGNRLFFIKEAVNEITKSVGTVLKKSDIFETEAWSYNDHNYLNSVIKIESRLLVFDLLTATKEIEKKLGRKTKTDKKKKTVYKSRVIDIDILFFNNDIIEINELTVPHPLIHKRMFVLKPLNQIAPDLIHPLFNKKIKTLLKKCSDKNKVEIYSSEL